MGAPLTSLPPPIGPYVARYVRLRRNHALVRAAGWAAVCLLAWGLGWCMIDRVAPLAQAARLALLCAGAGAAVVIVFRPLLRWLSHDVDWRAAAAEIERGDVRLGQRLQTVTSELLTPPRQGGSRSIVLELAREVGQVLQDQHPSRLFRWRSTLGPWLLVLLLAALAAGIAQYPVIGLPRLAARFVTPLRPIPPVTTTRLTLQPRTAAVVEGQPLRVTVIAERLTPDGSRGSGAVTLYVAPAQATRAIWSSLSMTPGEPGTFQAVIRSINQDLRYFARGGDGRSAIGVVRVLRRPQLAEVRVRYTYPPYTNRSPLIVSNADGLIEAPVGTEAAVTFVASEPLASAVLTVGDEKIQTAPGASPRERTATLTITKDQPYALSMVSVDHVDGSGPGGMMIRAVPDRPPLVQVLQPPGELRLSPRDIFSLPFQALDDYGLTSLTTSVQITPSGVDASGEPINLARGKPATQPSTWGGAAAARAVDGNVDGSFPAGSVTHTEAAGPVPPWWQVDLGNVAPVSVIEIWNRTDAAPERLSDFVVFVSDGPFLSDDPAAIAAQSGVGTFRVAETAGRPTTIEVFRTARYVRVQLAKPQYLSLAEVRVLQAKTAASPPTRSYENDLAITGDPRQQDGEMVLDLAKFDVGVGDVITVSVTSTDSGTQTGVGGPIRVVVSPRSIDQRTYDRINELKRAAQLAQSAVGQLESAAAGFDPAAARGVARVEAYLAALSDATRELSGVSETSRVLHSSLLRAIIRSDSPALSIALAAKVDELQLIAEASSALSATFAFDASPTEDDRALLASTLQRMRRLASDVAVILRGEQAGAVLADLDNLRASESGTPSGKEAADRARERARRVREDIEAAAKELGLSPGAPDVAARLREMVEARRQAIETYALPDYVPAAQAYAAAMAARTPLPGLVPRLSAAAQAEAIRPDGNLVRARDLQLAASAALRVRDASSEARNEFVASFAQAVAALQREHALSATPAPTTAPAGRAATGPTSPTTAPTTTPTTAPTPATGPATAAATPTVASAIAAATAPADDAIRAVAAEARRRLSHWSRGQSEQSASEAEALARAQELAMQANADLAQRAYESAEAADERIARELRLAERTFPRAVERFEQARQEVRRSTERAKLIDRLSTEQQQLAGAVAQDGEGLIGAQQALASDLARVTETSEKVEPNATDTDSRLAAVATIRTAQERLTSMPQQLRSLELALGERSAASARLRELRQQPMPVDEQPAAGRAIRDAEEQLREAEQALAERLAPLGDVVALELAGALASYAPETSDAVRGLYDRLRPAMARLQRAASSGAGDAGSAIAELRGAIDGLQTQLKDAQARLLERDPLTAARVYAAAAASSLTSDPSSAAASQQGASAALSRAWDVAIHDAAAARLAGLPTMRPLFAPAPEAAAEPPQGVAAGVGAKFPLLFDWGRLPWRPLQQLGATARPSDPPGYQDALQAYFEALGVTQPDPSAPTTREQKP